MSEKSYNTRQRELIMNILKENPGMHLTVDELTQRLAKDNKSVGKTTVYRYLDKLVKSGVVRKYISEPGEPACYEYIADNKICHSHYHLKCSQCTELIHTNCSFLDEIKNHVMAHHDFEMSAEQTVIYGLCASCKEKGQPK